MKKSVRSVISKFGFIAFAVSLNFFTACEIGLGSSVDVEAPKISFSDTTIDSGAVVRDTFAVFGKWEDDGSISSLNATLKNLTTGAEIKKAGTIADNSWNVTFSPADDAIADGSYELSIIIKDGANHESKISRAFVIDNTPPLVVLSRPSTKNGASSFDSYGQKFTLEGKAADDNDVSLIEVNVYADAACTGEPLKTISLPSVPLTIETDVAEYSSTIANDYSVIYGIVDDNGIAKRDGGTVARYCKLVVYDGAQRYPADGSAQTEADKKGNSIDYYYLNSDLAELFTEGYKITELYHILNGTYTESNARTTSPDGVVTLLKSDTTKVTTGQFKLNPENSPHFVVSARSILEAGHTIDEAPLTNGNSKLEVEIAPGLDGHLIKEETIGIYLVRCDNYGNPLKEDGSAAADESEAKIIWLVETDKHEQQAEITQSGSTYKFKTKTEVGNANYPDLMIGENYYVAVVGKDMQGNNILCDGIYGFQLITSGLNIEVGIRSEPDWISTNANANDVNKTPKIILTYSTENKPFEILRGLDAANLVSIDTGVMTSPYQDNLNITSTGPLGFEPTIVVYKVNGENSAESNPKSIELRYDDTAPQVTISEKPDEIATEQKSITFRGTAADKNSNGEEESGVKTVYIQILDKATPTNATPVAGSLNAIKASVSGGEWLCQIKPEDYAAAGSAFTTEGPKIIKVTAVDGVGLTSQVSDEFMFDTAKPKITLKKYNLYGEFNDASKAKNVDSTIVVGKTFRINGTLVEKYGLDASAGFKIKQEWKDFAETSTSEKTIDMPAADASGNWAITLPFNGTDGSAYDNDTIVNNHSADGIYTYTITAKDKAGKTDNDGITFTAKLKTDGPLLEISSPEFDSNVTKYWQKNRDIMFSGKASSPATVSAIYWTQDESKTTDSWTGWEKAEGTDYWNFTVSVAADGDNHKVFIAAVDSLGNKTSKLEYTIKVDSTGPEVAPKFYQIGSDVIQAVNGSSIYVSGLNPQNLTVYGKYNETVSGPYVPKTGDTLKPLAFQIDGADKYPTIKYSNTDISSLTADELSSDAVKNSFSATSPSLATNSWKAEFTTSDIAAGSFAVTARNGANVPKENTDLSIVIDSKKPEFGNSISITKSSYDRTEDQGDQNTENDVLYYYVNNRDKTTISGTASDANLLSVKIKAESTGKTTINKSETSNPYNWSFELDMTGWTSDTDVTLTVTDKAGNTATKLLKLVFDTTPPLAKHEWDKNDKDLYFRVGESDNVLKELKAWESSISALDTSLDKNVGGKYLKGTYGNSETIRIRGDFEEAGSGLSAIYYKAFESAPTEAAVKAFIASPETEKTGNAITPKIVEQRVSWTNDDGSKIFKENVQTSYTTLISDLKANKANYLVIVAVDKVGNVGLDYAEKNNYEETRDTDITKPEYYKAKKFEDAYYTINIDTVLPENEFDANTVTTDYINPTLSGDITISGVANSGTQAGVEKSSKVYVELLVNEKSIVSAKHDDYNENKDYGLVTLDTNSPDYAENNAHWTATIKTSKVFENKTTGTCPVSVIVTDAAGNKQTFSGVNINVDTTAPKVNINTIADADKDSTDKLDVNGKLTIDGTASDTEKLSSVKIEYKKTADSDTDTEGNSNWTELTQLSGSTPNNWKAELDTTTLDDKNNYDIRVTASDAAGNTKAETKTVYVNQDSDRPVVRFSNLTKDDDGNFILKYGKNASLEGTITDDDATSTAVVKVFKASSKPITSENDSTISGATSFNKATGDYTFTPADHADGSKTVYFYMEDNNGKKFYTTHTEDLNQPYQLYKTDTKTTTAQDGTVTSNNHAGEISYKSDSEAPEISSPKLQAFPKVNLTIPATINDWANSTAYAVDDVVHVEINGQTKTYACSKAYTSAVTGEFNADNWKDITPVYLGESCVVGGPTAAAYLETGKNYVELTASAKDANGINKIEITANGVTYDSTVAADGTVTTENEKDDSGNETGLVIYTFTTKRIDISGIAAGNVDVVVKVTDNSGLYSNNKTSFLVDRTAPDISISTPQNNGTLYYGTIEQNVAGSIIGGGDVNKVYFKVSLDTFNEHLADFTDGVDITNSLSSMASIVFDGKDTADANGFHTKTLQKWIEELKGDSYDKDDDTNVPVSVYYKAVDNCGNFSVKGCWLDVIPNGDKPVVNISYPTNKEDSSGNMTIIPALSGTIRLNGTAKCPAYSVDSVYIQIAKDYTASYNWDNWYTDSALTTGEYTIVDIPGSTMKGIKASGTVDNWNLPINSKKEFDPAAGNTSNTRNMAIRVYALHKRTPAGGSEIKKLSDPVIQQFTIDPNAPHIGGEDKVANGRLRHSLQLVQFENNYDGDFEHIANRKAYKSEMWVTGKWYLIASVYDNQGIDSIILSQPGSNDTTDLITNGWAKEADSGSAAKNYDLCIPLPTDSGVGNVVYTIEAKEKSDDNFNSKETIRINYDNTAPKLGTKDHDKYNIAPGVQQSNGFYTLNGYASDAEGDSSVSGMKAIAFYFMRRGSANTRVYDPMWKNKFVAVRTGSTDSSDITYSHGLYWKHKTLGTRNATNLKELSLTASDDNIHTGGLALLGGTIYRIESVAGTTVTVDEDVPLTITEADFALALVVDNLTKKETTTGRDKITTEGAYGYGYHGASPTADDGDLMQEDWDGTTTEGQWVARINSANIPDGPIEIHYVAFDKSQNYAVGIVGNVAKTAYLALPTKDALANKDITGTEDATTKLATNFYYAFSTPAYVSNNAPRIAGVTVGTDYNGDGDITDGSNDTLNEKRTKYVETDLIVINGTAQTKVTKVSNKFIASSNQKSNGDPLMTVKDKTSIELEIIGGNGNMYYQYNIAADYSDSINDADFTKNNTALTINRTTKEGLNEEYKYYVTSTLPALEFTEEQLKAAVGGNNGTNGQRWWTIQIWDSTEETTHFENSQYAELKLPLNVQILDKTDPNTVISPLYWNSATDNSVYRDANDTLFGHIELIKDLETAEGKLGNDSLYGSEDDKISGIVVFKGYAYDNKRLSKLMWGIVDHKADNAYTSPTYLFPATNSALQDGATFTGGVWSSKPAQTDAEQEALDLLLETKHYTFVVSDAEADGAYLDSKGHKVAWTLTVDTSYIKNVVEKDARLYVYAEDEAGGKTTITNTAVTSTSTDQETYDLQTKIPTYQVDILPYITSVTTRLAAKDVVSRTALGHYPIASDENSIILSGYNLAQNNTSVTLNATSRSSGAYEYPVGNTGISTINNINNNSAHGDYNVDKSGLAQKTKVTNMYNRQPDTNTNLNLTDDVYFDVWEINADAATSGYPALKYPVMHINPSNNQIGFGFVRGTDSVSFPANGNSYAWYQKNNKDYVNTNFVYDTKGIAHTISIGLDAQFGTGIAGRMNYNHSGWYGDSYTSRYNNRNYTITNRGSDNVRQWDKRYNVALESIGIPNGVYLKNVKTNVANGEGTIDIERFSTPSMAVATHGDNTAVYIIYYDTNQDQIRFRYGLVPTTETSRGDTIKQFGLLNDSKSEQQRCTSVNTDNADTTTIPDDNHQNGDDYNKHGMFEADREFFSLVTGKYYKQAHDTNANEGIADNIAAGTEVYDTKNNGSEIHAIGVIPSADGMNDDKVVMVWYDKTVSRLKYIYRTNLGTSNNDALDRSKAKRDADNDGVSAGDKVYWSAPKDLFGTNNIPVSKIALTVDKNEGIHIAAYDQTNADLVYAYLPSYNHLDTANNKAYVCRVDAYSQIGTDLTIDTAIVDNKVVPYISYYAEGLAALPKVAYLVNGIDTTSIATSVVDGADKDTKLFTGKWEVSLIPTTALLQRYDVSIGLFKDADGALTSPAKTTDVATSKDERKRYANGTTNLVVGYATKQNGTGYIETAMRKGVPDKVQH